MPNDTDTDVLADGTDTDVLAGGGADKSSDVMAGGGADPGADVSMQDISGATPMASPLGGQQPGQLPPMIAQGAAAQTTPVGAVVHQRHGGLLTGLAGVLLDGLAAGIMTPQSGQGFSQAAARAYQMPLERQQNQMAMQEFKTQQQLDQAKIAQAHVTYLQSLALANRLSDEQRAGVTDDFMKNIDSIKTAAPDAIEQLSTTPNADTAVQMINQMRIQDPSKGAQYWRFPTEHDGEGNVTEWGVYKLDLDKPIGRDVTMRLPGVDAQGNYEMRPLRIPGSTTIRDYMTLHGEDGMKGLMQMAVAGVKAQEKEGTDLIKSMNPTTGELEYVSRGTAQARGWDASGPKINASQQQHDVVTQRQMNDAQLSVSQFNARIDDVARLSPEQQHQDEINLNVALRDEGITQGQLTIPEVGKLEIPIVDAATQAYDRIIKADAFRNLSKPSQGLLIAERQMTAAVPAYQRALMESARAGNNPQQIGLDLATLPNGIDVIKDANLAKDRMEAFQQRIYQATQGVPNLKSLGVDSIDDVRARWEPAFKVETMGRRAQQTRTPAAQTLPSQQVPPPAQRTFQKGDVVPGREGKQYRFKGGDAKDKSNWELVQPATKTIQ